MSAKLLMVIETKGLRGKGVEGGPVREVTQYWSLEGQLLAESDPVRSSVPRREEKAKEQGDKNYPGYEPK